MSPAAATGGRVRRSLVAVMLLVLAALLLPATPASAHAVLVSSDPRDGSRIAAAPASIRLVFDENVTLPNDGAVVLGPDGARVGRGAPRLTGGGTTVVVPLQRDLGTGIYSVAWRVVSADSHVVTGSVRFGVRTDVDVTAPVSTSSPLDVPANVATGVLYLGIALGIGVPAAATAFWPAMRRRRRVLALAAEGLVLAGIATVADLLLRGARVAGTGWEGLLRLDDLGYTVSSSQGVVLVARLVLLVGLAALLLVRPASGGRGRIAASAAAAVLVLASVAALGHATDGVVAVLLPAATLHLAAMVVWLGGLVVLVTTVLPGFCGRSEAALAALRRWSIAAFVCVGVLIVTGEIQAFPVVAPFASLWDTDYGRLLLLKLLLVALVLVAAAVSQRVVARRTGTAAKRLRRVVAIEVVGVLAVLGVTGVLTGTATAAETYGPRVERTMPALDGEVDVVVDSTKRGSTVIRVRAEKEDGEVIRLQTLSGSVATEGVPALDVTFRRDGDGWRSTDASLPLAGEWTLTLQVEVSDAAAYATSTTWPVW